MDRNSKIIHRQMKFFSVALRKESVDRNILNGYFLTNGLVALRKESVDRNTLWNEQTVKRLSRSPQGERG